MKKKYNGAYLLEKNSACTERKFRILVSSGSRFPTFMQWVVILMIVELRSDDIDYNSSF